MCVENHCGVVKFTTKVTQSKFGTKSTQFTMVVPVPVFSTKQSALSDSGSYIRIWKLHVLLGSYKVLVPERTQEGERLERPL